VLQECAYNSKPVGLADFQEVNVPSTGRALRRMTVGGRLPYEVSVRSFADGKRRRRR